VKGKGGRGGERGGEARGERDTRNLFGRDTCNLFGIYWARILPKKKLTTIQTDRQTERERERERSLGTICQWCFPVWGGSGWRGVRGFGGAEVTGYTRVKERARARARARVRESALARERVY
jgi:hypothetical protein